MLKGIRLGCLCTWVVALMVTSSASLAQDYKPPTEFSTAFQADYIRRDMTAITDELELDRDQQAILEALYLDYERSVAEGIEALRETLGEIKPKATPNRSKELNAAREQHRKELNALRADFKARLKKASNAKQRERLMDDYRRQVQQSQQRIRDMQKSGRPGGEVYFETLSVMGVEVKAWEREKAALATDFELNVQAILSQDQEPRWPGLERRLRREKSLQLGKLSGESVDLLLIVRELDLPIAVREELAPTLEEYAVRLDDALRTRNAYLDESREIQWEAVRNQDTAAGLAAIQHETALRVSVRDVNETFVELIAAGLVDPDRTSFMRHYHERGFPRIYRPTRVGRLFDHARGLEDLPDEAAATLQGLESAYLAELDAANERLRENTLTHEPGDRRREFDQLVRKFTGKTGPNAASPLSAAYQSRRVMEERYLAELRSVVPDIVPSARGTAAPGGKQSQGGLEEAKRRRQELVERFDADGDGELNPQELRKAKEALQGGG